MGALRITLLAALLLVPTVAPQPEPDPSAVGGPINEAARTAAPVVENQTGEDLSSEQIDLQLKVDIVNAEFDLVGVLFGGGKAQTDVTAHANLAFYAVNVSRVETAMQSASGDANVTLNGTFGIDTNRTVLTAEEVRTAGGGALLEAFQSYQEDATKTYIEETIPQVRVITSRFSWENTEPAHDEREDQETSLREPPIVLNATLSLQYLDRFSLADLLETQLESNDTDAKTPQERLQQSLEENQTEPFFQRDAFEVLGIGQLLQMNLPAGWRMNLTVTVPKGFTIAGATDALVVSDDHRTASYYLDGTERELPRVTSGVITLSDRFLVLSTLAGAVGLIGVFLRLPTEMAAFALLRRYG